MAVEQQYDALAEQAVLASIFSTPEILDDLNDVVNHTDFYEVRNQVIYETIVDLQQEGRSFDPINLAGELKRRGQFQTVGGVGYITEILAPNRLSQYGTDPIGHAEIIRDLSLRRKLINLSTEILETSAIGTGLSASEAMGFAEESILRIAQEDASAKPLSAADMYDSTLQHIEEVSQIPEGSTPGIPSGFTMLDDMTGGWLPGQMIVIAARPSVGKTALAMDFARNAAYRAGKSVLFVNLEMGPQELMLRLLAAETPVQLQNLKKGRLTQEEYMALNGVESKIKASNLFFDATNFKVTLSHIRSRAVRQKYSPSGLDLLIIDHLGLVEIPTTNKNQNRENQVSGLSRGIKNLAKELDIPVILLAQLNRGPEQRTDKKPQLSDLRESGAIEQDADIAMLIHRPDQSDPNIRPGEADLIIAKNRNGPTDKIPLTPMLEFAKYMQGDGIISRDMTVYDDSANSSGETQNFPPPTEEDEVPW